ncbi:MAG TPA: tetratricopeptide repeat protein [Gemmatimonadaceae bacterium]|nr:tetratricopeptide repeat protein [Gemmatimonadaceae bacterium]
MANSARIDELKKKFDENPRRYFAPLANEYRKAGDPEQAIAICREFLPQQPGHMSGHIVYGQALFDAQQFDEARTVFDTALTLDPENLIALRSLGDIARGLGDAATARAWYQRVLDADPRNEEIAALLTTLASSGAETPPQVPEAAAPSEPAEMGPTGTVVMGALKLDGLEEAVPEALAPAESAPAMELLPEAPETPAAAAPEAPSAAAPSPADGLLDLDALTVEPEATVSPRISMPRASLSEMGFSVERADDDLMLPATDEEPSAAPSAAAAPDPFATETMAELYRSQGHFDEALRVYRQLLSQKPGDAVLQAKVAELEGAGANEFAASPELVAEEPVQEVPDLDATAFRFERSEPERAAEPEPEPETVHASVDELPELEIPSEPVAAEPEIAVAEPEVVAAAPSPALDFDLESTSTGEHEVIAEKSIAEFSSTDFEAPIPEVAVAEVPEPLVAAALAQEAEFVEPPSPTPAAVAEAAPVADEPPAAGPSIRDFLASLAGVGPAWALPVEPAAAGQPPGGADAQTEPVAEAAIPAVVAEPEPTPQPAPIAEPVPAPVADALPQLEEVPAAQEPIVAGGSIDSLFGSAGVSGEDQGAAAALAGAFGAVVEEDEGRTPSTPIEGAPARRASGELSLDSVFREPGAGGAQPAQGFSFDKFFANPTPAMGSPAAPTPPLGQAPASPDDDIEQFNSWLDGLKKR